MTGYQRHIFVCTNKREPDDPRGSCSKLGSEALHACFKQEVKRLNLKGVVRANKAGCLDYCAQGPTVVVYPEGIWYRVTSEGQRGFHGEFSVPPLCLCASVARS